MFLTILSDKEKESFVQLASIIIHADERINKEETELFRKMKIEMQLNEDVPIDSNVDIKDACSNFTTHKSKSAALIELIGIAYVDGEVPEQEMRIIMDIAKHFNFDIEKVGSFIKWVEQMMDLTQKGLALIES